MRNFMTTLVSCAALAFGAVACDGGETDPFTPTTDNGGTTTPDNGGSPDTGGTPDAGPGEDTTAPTQYFAVYVSDITDFDCSNNSKNHGADIDAIELIDAVTDASAGFVTDAGGMLGDGSGSGNNCSGEPSPASQELNNIKGAPNGDLSGGFVALAGGYLTAEFGSLEITDAYEIQIYEVGTDECGSQGCKDDEMTVGIATDLSCDITSNLCSLELSSTAVGDAVVPVGAL